MIALTVLLYCGLRTYNAFLAHRAASLLAEATRIPVGATEESILPLIARYGGGKLASLPPLRTDDCVEKAGCEEWNAHIPDYAYEVDLSPFDVSSRPDKQAGRLHKALVALMCDTSSSWRNVLSLRDSMVYVQIGIRARHVETVDAGLFVEGRTRWLGNTWELFPHLPRSEMRHGTYAVEGSFLTFPGNGGAGTMHYLTPAATSEQFQAAQNFNFRCLTGLVPCRFLCDLTPDAFHYLSQHPEVGSTISIRDCPDPHS